MLLARLFVKKTPLVPLNRSFSSSISHKMQIHPLLARSDNWMYLVVDEVSNEAAVVDPYDWKKMLGLVKEKGVNVTTLITTHHHDDHSGGNIQFLSNHPQGSSIKAYAGSRSPGTNTVIKDKDEFTFGKNIKVKALHTPCHTQDSICFYLQDEQGKKAVFTGDTLFQGGCGRFFEGTPEEMHKALIYLGTLPEDTIVYNGHEYTPGNAKFALKIEPDNADVKRLAKLAEDNDCTAGLSTIADEKKWNVFMRLDQPAVQKATGATDAVSVMGALRELKNKA
ncbi:putative hydroxyacylglutathione hydrolase [Filobasidium floriforme]|uniref:putative hydroxyacylglutathione hydrolase n=1 Tax=Filobasidium floriforme TaxID=5210 RepID=UPI001E8E2927|nr:putative hydroxyacylglutathione hydrolase [Filobasidium floriforme]KAH8088069.1 putative hydroxyacylglutathione hydrolase [Filobasidium floriforme]